MRHPIPVVGWAMALADAISAAHDGDVVVVHSVDMQELAARACQGLCPDKELVFEIQALPSLPGEAGA